MLTEYEQAICEAKSHIKTEGEGPILDALKGLEEAAPFAVAAGLFPCWELFARRPLFVQTYSFAIPSEEALAEIAKHAPILEVGAGSGYWAYELAKRGVEVVATDPWPVSQGGNHYMFRKEWTPVLATAGVDAVAVYAEHTLLLVWPCLGNPWAADVLEAYGGETLIFVGESVGGCTADDRFYQLLEERFTVSLEMDIPQWFGIHDYLSVYRRKG
jgi:hypothetical protein